MNNRVVRFFDRMYIAIMVPIAATTIYFNWYALHNVKGLVYYEHYRNIIKAGFNYENLITFPMWGYGFLMLLTTDKLGLIIIQTLVALVALAYFVRLLEEDYTFSPSVIRAFKIGMVMSLPWYAAHALRWPYSFTISFIPITIVLLYKAFNEQNYVWIKLISSALLFGIVLNFRSDYWLMPLGLAFLLVVFYRTKRSFLQAIIWLIILYSTLIPWALYTKKACGHHLLVSTNSGHVVFIGLGNDPQNRWGITPHDGDPVMNNLVNDYFKTTHHSTLDYEADQLLKKTFFQYITAYPWDYIKKCIYAFKLLFKEGFYAGEFFMDEQGEISIIKDGRVRALFLKALIEPSFLVKNFFSIIKLFLHTASYFMGRHILFLSYLFFPLIVGINFYRRRSMLILLISAVIVYQTMINVFCFQMACYSSSLYLFYLLQAIYGASLVYGLLSDWYATKWRLCTYKSAAHYE